MIGQPTFLIHTTGFAVDCQTEQIVARKLFFPRNKRNFQAAVKKMSRIAIIGIYKTGEPILYLRPYLPFTFMHRNTNHQSSSPI